MKINQESCFYSLESWASDAESIAPKEKPQSINTENSKIFSNFKKSLEAQNSCFGILATCIHWSTHYKLFKKNKNYFASVIGSFKQNDLWNTIHNNLTLIRVELIW